MELWRSYEATFQVIFVVIALKLENVGPTLSRFNPCTSLPSKATDSLRKQPTLFWRHYHWFPHQMISEKRVQKFYTMMCHYLDLGSAFDWSCCMENLTQPIWSITQIWVVTRHQYRISVLVSQTTFDEETSGSITKFWLFSQAKQQTAANSFNACKIWS